jgi:hypothetical protein
MKDPYLIPGWPCEITWNRIKFLKYFLEIENGKRLVFASERNKSCGFVFKNYRPVGTEWDYAPS